jgi:hypothetical protein
MPPNATATQLIYMTLFEQTPVGVSFHPGLDPAIATVLPQAALDTWKGEPSRRARNDPNAPNLRPRPIAT